MSKKFIFAVIATFIFVGCVIAYNYYETIFGKTITKNTVIYVKSSDSLLDIKENISAISEHSNTFLLVAAKKNFSTPKPGRYILKEGMSNNDVVNLLRSGNQTPIKLSFNNQDTLEKLAGRVAEQLETDSISLLKAFKEEVFLSKNKLTEKSVLQIFIPNTYEVYWTISPEKFRSKMLVAYKRFWNKNRLQKAKNLNLTKEEVITLASIVQKETAQKTERPIVAGLYLNRLKNGWPLQADPTIIYAIKENKGSDYVVKRVLTADLAINSPYNTYKFKGLPPTLISMPDISAIEGVLNAEKHNYYYMCASIDKIGYHEFAKTLTQHNRNAYKYQQWLNKKGVNR